MNKIHLNLEIPHLIKGGISLDKRGSVSFVNEFNFNNIKRFYIINHTSSRTFRAWQAHKNENKYFFVTHGDFIINLIRIVDWENPLKESKALQYRLSQTDNSILMIPKGYANGFVNLDSNSELLIFSSSTLKESLEDDYRFNKNYFVNCNWEF